ncbi:HEPN domain-containing protein [Pseudomonas sp. N040]|uniref:HEPN domain-containing protein n=1 Tax=Pseudomonas sp. N040 TaxID=2785325 RepID=UPI0018A24930|nr:HEPN domain-containing protein [Pseudomonas sp. N040]MBF7728609.1 hypothetical protein [Pseudomonas sp. N040]MBW7012249.1 hypothetical protein [Pseudomonas sp. N040]
MRHEELKARQRKERENHPPNLALRVHRALSWLGKAESSEDDDSRFIFLWIAFNAAYATEIDENSRLSEQETFKAFLKKLCDLDTQSRISELVWNEFSGSIRVLLDNPFVFHSFWEFQRGRISAEDWQSRFDTGKRSASMALAGGNPAEVLAVVFNRIYVLRNQMMHGGATWSSQVNRDQLRDCARFLGKLVPLVIEIMLDNPNTLWGDACFPVVQA